MFADSDSPPLRPGSAAAAPVDSIERDHMMSGSNIEVPSTPLGPDVIPASQETIPSTEGPGSPMDADDSFQTELNDADVDADAAERRQVIPSSLTPPPSSQVREHHSQQQQQQHQQNTQHQNTQHQNTQKQRTTNGHSSQPVPSQTATSYAASSQPSAILSPPGTGLHAVRRDGAADCGSAAAAAAAAAEFTPPSPSRIASASPEELRALLQASIAEQTRLKTETAHHKLQYNLLNMQADEDAKRAAVEHEMTRREVEALRMAESGRQARRELGVVSGGASGSETDSSPTAAAAAAQTAQAKYQQLKVWYDEAVEENDSLQKRVKLAKRVIQQKEEEMAGLVDEKELLLNRLRENREHFHLLCSPGGLFHGAMTPKAGTSPVRTRATPYQTPKGKMGVPGSGSVLGSSSRLAKDRRLLDPDQGTAPIAALLQALSQENNSAPSTPLAAGHHLHHHMPSRRAAKHVRNVQSLSSLPTTPTSRVRGEYTGLLPSVDLVPQTEPPPLRFSGPVTGGNGSSSSYAHSHHGHGHGHSHSVSYSTGGRYFPETPTRPRHRLPGHAGRKSRESTISADEDDSNSHETPGAFGGDNNEEIARQALESVAARARASFSRTPQLPQLSQQSSAQSTGRPDEEVFESQASQAASAMLRRDPRESFEVAASSAEGSRDGTPAAAVDKTAKLQAKLFGGVIKGGGGGVVDKRKFSGPAESTTAMDLRDDLRDDLRPDLRENLQASPTKKVRIVPSLRDGGNSSSGGGDSHHYAQQRVGLGIQYN